MEIDSKTIATTCNYHQSFISCPLPSIEQADVFCRSEARPFVALYPTLWSQSPKQITTSPSQSCRTKEDKPNMQYVKIVNPLIKPVTSSFMQPFLAYIFPSKSQHIRPQNFHILSRLHVTWQHKVGSMGQEAGRVSAFDAVVKTWDTANMYSSRVSEKVFGEAITKYDIPRSQVIIITKPLFPVCEDQVEVRKNPRYINR